MAGHSLEHFGENPAVRHIPDAVLDLSDDANYDQAVAVLAALTDRLLDDVKDMDDDGVRQPSLLPGWSRGHVLTHIARNADALCNIVEWARTGVEKPGYSSIEARNAAIEAGSGRSASELEADIDASGERLLEAIAGLPRDRRHVIVRTGSSGIEAPAHDILWWRIREVGYHHVDLGIGYGFGDLPTPVLIRGLDEAVDRVRLKGGPPLWLDTTDEVAWSSRGGSSRAGMSPDDADGPLQHGADRAQLVQGSLADLLAWLTGRSAGEDLRSDQPLPALPAWG
jgi:maleylpyruvate isomerase